MSEIAYKCLGCGKALPPFHCGTCAACAGVLPEFAPVDETTAYYDDEVAATPPAEPAMTLPTDSAVRKDFALYRGCFRYFPAALAGVARISKLGNDKHNPGEPMHHARGKSMDHGDCILRHLMDASDLIAAYYRIEQVERTKAILDEVDQLAWRALAFSQMLHEQFGGAPLAPGAKE